MFFIIIFSRHFFSFHTIFYTIYLKFIIIRILRILYWPRGPRRPIKSWSDWIHNTATIFVCRWLRGTCGRSLSGWGLGRSATVRRCSPPWSADPSGTTPWFSFKLSSSATGHLDYRDAFFLNAVLIYILFGEGVLTS